MDASVESEEQLPGMSRDRGTESLLGKTETHSRKIVVQAPRNRVRLLHLFFPMLVVIGRTCRKLRSSIALHFHYFSKSEFGQSVEPVKMGTREKCDAPFPYFK